MKGKLCILSIAAAALAFSACTISKPAERVRTITVSGSGRVDAEPDIASMEFSVNTAGWIMKQVVADNAVIMARVLDAVRQAGVGDADISTADYSIGQERSWQNGRQVNGRYTAANTIRVVVRNMDIIGDVIDAAVRAGANGLQSLSFQISDQAGAVRQARTAAIQQAQDAAALLAGASGCRLGDVISIQEGASSGGVRPIMMKSMAAADSAAATPIEQGSVSVTANVTVTYALQ
ncbi:MAG: SIMPL domain-containing protein [Treponemataceae bacterium]|nr:SIMPL domain-containing protein [Treponemataceae bacterium]